MSDLKCVAGCMSYYGGELKHHKSCPFYHNSLSEMFDKMAEQISTLEMKLEKLNPVKCSGRGRMTCAYYYEREHGCFECSNKYKQIKLVK